MNMIKEWLNKFFKSGKIIVIIFCFNVIILLLHLFRASFVQIDNTTILLMLLVLLTPFASHIKKIKFGDFEAEINQDIKKAEQQAKEIKSEGGDKEQVIKKNSVIEELEELAAKDPVLALAKLRIEIEKKLKRLYTFKETVPSGIKMMTQVLAGTGVISNKLRRLILDVTSILNRVVHGEDIPTETNIDKILNIGSEILDELDYILFQKFIAPASKKRINKKELNEYMDAVYEVTTVVPLVNKPQVNTRLLNQEQLYEFLDGYEEYAEFLVEIKKIK
ncbi:MAG: hypothetical protein UV37_C0016G0009 [Candidatus Collierbacteria bacterium GW2011_GWA1_42_60]|nr:MAG: hypothetical protein UV29_C0027G0004 [Candidatus Collierbacteria bacterium GW2011_GWD2_42_50]KKS66767.1 MAG: hypothetical protein UV37_C0016G0009 [Candidatus Collierbacteria bacterium GW2011_GWA1_42_60]HAS68798.1 hypothetical protein [Candidatus Collierbacteria bacterium]HBX63847.1 hypothetical protein [Candidatus Collierbacteria bacterium]